MNNFNDVIDNVLKNGFSDKKKEEDFKIKLSTFVDQINLDILNQAKLLILSAYSSVKSGREKDDW